MQDKIKRCNHAHVITAGFFDLHWDYSPNKDINQFPSRSGDRFTFIHHLTKWCQCRILFLQNCHELNPVPLADLKIFYSPFSIWQKCKQRKGPQLISKPEREKQIRVRSFLCWNHIQNFNFWIWNYFRGQSGHQQNLRTLSGLYQKARYWYLNSCSSKINFHEAIDFLVKCFWCLTSVWHHVFSFAVKR